MLIAKDLSIVKKPVILFGYNSFMKLILTLLLFFTAVFAETGVRTLKAEYAISYAIFGKIGKADALLRVEQDRYSAVISAQATGVAKLMSNRRVERYQSNGKIVNGRLVPLIFTTLTLKGKHYRAEHRFLFDHKAKIITEISDITDRSVNKHTEKKHDYYAQDDILTLFFNLRFYLKNRCKSGQCTLTAVGANEKDGRVDITALGENNFKVVLHRRIFASKQGEMKIHINEIGICDKSLLKDVVFFGDVKSEVTKIIYPNIEEKR